MPHIGPSPRSPRRWLASSFALTLLAMPAEAQDWPQWRGPGRLGVWTETGVVDRFPDDGLTVAWRVPVRPGFAGPVVADGRVFVLDYQEDPGSRTMDGAERMLALDEETGDILWTREWPATYRNLMRTFATGPRATPTVYGDRIYVVGAAGMLLCLETTTGDVVWQIDTVAEYGVTVPVYGVSNSPLVDGNRLVVVVGGEPDALVVAFDTDTGDEVWRALPLVSEAGYSPPMVYESGGVRQLVLWHPQGVSSLDPETGSVYWEHEWPIGTMTVSTPISAGPYLMVSHFFRGTLMLRLDRDRPGAQELWRGQSRSELPGETDGLHSLITTPLIIGDYVYGVGSYGELRCLDARTGERLWETTELIGGERWGTAFFVQHEDRVIVVGETGELILARFTPEGYTELDRTSLIAAATRTRGGASGTWGDRGVVWAHPAFANRHIVMRNDEEVIRVSLAAADYQ